MRIVVLFNLKEGVEPGEYEAWARTRDLPAVRGLESVSDFSVHAATGLLGSDETPPYAYVEVIDVDDMECFSQEVAGKDMKRIAAEFQAFAQAPAFMLTRRLEPVQ